MNTTTTTADDNDDNFRFVFVFFFFSQRSVGWLDGYFLKRGRWRKRRRLGLSRVLCTLFYSETETIPHPWVWLIIFTAQPLAGILFHFFTMAPFFFFLLLLQMMQKAKKAVDKKKHSLLGIELYSREDTKPTKKKK